MTTKYINSDTVFDAIAKLLNIEEPLSKVTKLTVVLTAGEVARYNLECLGLTKRCEPPYTKHIDPMEMETQNALWEARLRDG